MSGGEMQNNFIIFTNHKKGLSFLAKFSDKESYEREIARKIGISYGSANKVLNDLYSNGLLKRRREGKMYFYSINKENAMFKPFKILNNIILLQPLIKKLKRLTKRIVLYGSCAEGTDNSESDIDLFIISEQKRKALQIIKNYSFKKGFKDIKIQPVIQTPIELLESEKGDKEFLSLVREGIVLWEKQIDESRI